MEYVILLGIIFIAYKGVVALIQTPKEKRGLLFFISVTIFLLYCFSYIGEVLSGVLLIQVEGHQFQDREASILMTELLTGEEKDLSQKTVFVQKSMYLTELIFGTSVFAILYRVAKKTTARR